MPLKSDSRMQKASTKTAEIAFLSQWELIRRRFCRHKLALFSLFALSLFYVVAIFVEFVAPHSNEWQLTEYSYAPPQFPSWSYRHGLFVYPVIQYLNPITRKKSYYEEKSHVIPLGFFVQGEPYKLWGLIPMRRHLIGIDLDEYEAIQTEKNLPADLHPTFYVLGADKFGRDLFSRILHGARISLSIGLVGIFISFVLGIIIGGISGYLSGRVDNLIQRTIEILNSFPKLPLWLALGAALPRDWPPLKIYAGIIIILSLMGWTGLARVVRGKLLSLREEDYILAAKLLGASHRRIILRHLIPGMTSHIIVSLTLSVPGMILGETSLSFLGLGLKPPVVSWGVLLQDCMNIGAVANYPWMLLPSVFIVITVLCFNFMGDGLRDAADPYA